MQKFIYTLVFLAFVSTLNAQWEADVRLTNNPAYSWGSYNNAWTIAANGMNVHVVWDEERDGHPEIYYKRSTLSGLTWGADTRLTNNTAGKYYPSIAVSGSVIHIVWRDLRNLGSSGNNEIYYKRSTDNGTTWEADTRLTYDTLKSYNPSIAVSGSVVHVVWHDERNGVPEIYYKRSTNAGVTWGADTRLTNNPAFSQDACVAVSGSIVCVVWIDDRDNNFEIYYKRSTDAGVTWGTDTRLSNNTNVSKTPSVAISGSVVNVVWCDLRDGNEEIYLKRTTNAGANWGTETRLTIDTNSSTFPSITMSDSFTHIVWKDKRNGNAEIYYKRSTNAGVNWEADTRLTNNTSNKDYASLAASNSMVHVLWSDYRHEATEKYYKRNPTGNVISGIQHISSEIPTSYSLSQNYPNPFNPTTKIKFDVARVGDVKIAVYDAMGREVQTLVNESLQSGTYEAEFDGSQLTSGVYFYKLITGDFTETKKMLMIK
ncbi:MAG: exo-alpha-sialidase [Ignavibacteriae bacterium]|nr:exo-alpha-sialidase [Ignavibacteriota bacterium]